MGDGRVLSLACFELEHEDDGGLVPADNCVEFDLEELSTWVTLLCPSR